MASKGMRGKWGHGCAIAAASGLVLVILAIIGVCLYDRMWERRLEAKLQEYRDAGQPVTWAEVLARRPRVPDDENAALVLLDAFSLLEKLHTEADDFLEGTIPAAQRLGWRNSETTLALARVRLEALKEPLSLLHRASQLPAAVFPVDSSLEPWNLNDDYLPRLREAARLLNVEAIVLAQTSGGSAAVAPMLDSAALPPSLDAGTTLVHGLVRLSLGDIWTTGPENVIALGEVPVGSLRVLRERATQEDEGLTMVPALYGERAFGHAIFTEKDLTGLISSDPARERAFWRLYAVIPGWKEKDALSYYDWVSEMIRIDQMPPAERLSKARKLGDEVERELDQSPKHHMIAVFIIPDAARLIDDEVRGRACLRAAAAALAVEEWRMTHGAWPESIDRMVPEILEAVPEDPMSGQPLRYKRRDDGVVIYSVGPDGRDDGGTTLHEAREAAGGFVDEGWDIAIRLLNPELRGAQTMTFRDEVMGVDGLSRESLEKAGFPEKRLLELGLTEDDLARLR